VGYIMKKGVFCNWPCNSIFELQRTFATHCIYMMWVLTNKLHELQNCNSLYIWCNSLQLNCNLVKTIFFQLLCNSIITALMMSCWCHWLSSIYENLTRGIMKKIGHNCFLKILISIIHYDCWWWSKIMTHGTIKKLPDGILIVFWKQKCKF